MKLKQFIYPAVLASLFTSKSALAAPTDLDVILPRQGSGCSASTECCIILFNTAGCGATAVQELGVDIASGCKTLLIGMYAAWVAECTGYFEGCMLYGETGCGTGSGVYTLYNNQNSCINPGFTIKSVECYGI